MNEIEISQLEQLITNTLKAESEIKISQNFANAYFGRDVTDNKLGVV